MTNNVKLCKKSIEELKLSHTVFSQWDVRTQEVFAKNEENKED